jgi:hypothetical protein
MSRTGRFELAGAKEARAADRFGRLFDRADERLRGDSIAGRGACQARLPQL